MQTHASEAPTPRYMRVRSLAAALDVSPATIWRWAAAGRIPQPVKLSPGVTAWKCDAELEAALKARESA